MEMKQDLDAYREQRESFLRNVVHFLSKDDRFVAAWLTGSFSRNKADALSDIDLSIVVAEEHSETLCRRLSQVSATTSPERYALFHTFGAPALIHENNNNAPDGGTFTFVLYSNSAVMVDWILIPQSKAKQPYASKLLFDKIGIPIPAPPEPEQLEQRRKSVAEQWAFFWMMAAITIKYITRNDDVFVTEWIEHLHALIRDIERKLDGAPWNYVRGSISQLQTTRESQLKSLHQLCQKMLELKPRVSELIGAEPQTPIHEIETLFSFAMSSSEITNLET